LGALRPYGVAMYRERLESVIDELDDIIYQVRNGNFDPASLQGTNLNPTNCESAAEQLVQACDLVMKFIDTNFTE
jgi:hypothetical protein